MKPALFSVLCEIKEKTGALVSFLPSAFQKKPHSVTRSALIPCGLYFPWQILPLQAIFFGLMLCWKLEIVLLGFLRCCLRVGLEKTSLLA